MALFRLIAGSFGHGGWQWMVHCLRKEWEFAGVKGFTFLLFHS